MLVTVEQRHIDAGAVGLCPIALALEEVTNKACVVTRAYVAFFEGPMSLEVKRMFRFATNGAFWNWVEDFDKGCRMEPFSFELPDSAAS